MDSPNLSVTRRQAIAAGIALTAAAAGTSALHSASPGRSAQGASNGLNDPQKMPVVFVPHGGGPWPFADTGIGSKEELEPIVVRSLDSKKAPTATRCYGHRDLLHVQPAHDRFCPGHRFRLCEEGLQNLCAFFQVRVHGKGDLELRKQEPGAFDSASPHHLDLQLEGVGLSEPGNNARGGLGIQPFGIEKHAIQIEYYCAWRG